MLWLLKNEMEIERIIKLSDNRKEILEMIFSNNIDKIVNDVGCISINNAEKLVEELMFFMESEQTKENERN